MPHPEESICQMRFCPIKLTHIWGLGALPDHHKDPFDRLLIAQSSAEKIPLISDDSKIAKYSVTVV